MNEPLCAVCGHKESAHIASGPNATMWCRLCYGTPDHKRLNHDFMSAEGH